MARQVLIQLALIAGLVGIAGGQTFSPSEKRESGLGQMMVAQLIDRLADVSDEGVGLHSTAWAGSFLALDEEPSFRGGILGSRKPVASPVLRELVRRGNKALPELLKHLSDARATKLVFVHDGFIGATWHSDEYDPRDPDPRKNPANVNTCDRRDRKHLRTYTFRVGDLCYVAVGQVVNRHLNTLRYQPTMCQVINSPVETPALAEAARKDWSGLTADAHKLSLINDAMDRSPWAAGEAVKRLCFYYPAAGEHLALKLLSRPLYSGDPLWLFITSRLVATSDPAQWPRLIDDFRRQEGQSAADSIAFRLRWIYWETSFVRDVKFLADQRVAKAILTKLYPLRPVSSRVHQCYRNGRTTRPH